MAPNDLVTPDELAGLPGAPFTQAIVDMAAAEVRAAAGWHIAPVRTETVTVDSNGGLVLYLPTRRLTSVTEVRDVTGDAPVVLGDWRASVKGKLARPWCWPVGFGAVEADIVHGYEVCPPELLPVLAAFCRAGGTDPRVQQESLGSWSRTLGDGGDDGDLVDAAAGVFAALDRLSIPWGAA